MKKLTYALFQNSTHVIYRENQNLRAFFDFIEANWLLNVNKHYLKYFFPEG